MTAAAIVLTGPIMEQFTNLTGFDGSSIGGWGVIKWPIILLLFSGGLELSFDRVREMRRQVFGLGAMELLVNSGLLIVAKKRAALVELHRMLREGAVEKVYTAIVKGIPGRDAFEIDEALARFLDLGFGEFAHRRVARHFLGGRNVFLALAIRLVELDHRADLGVFARQLAIAVEIGRGIFGTEQLVEFFEADGQLRELGGNAWFHSECFS